MSTGHGISMFAGVVDVIVEDMVTSEAESSAVVCVLVTRAASRPNTLAEIFPWRPFTKISSAKTKPQVVTTGSKTSQGLPTGCAERREGLI